MKKSLFTLGFAAIAITSMPAHAQSFIFHLEGDVGNRQAYFSRLGTTDRTPPNIEFQPIEIKELKVAIIYEHPQHPEMVEFLLQFECVGKFNHRKSKVVKRPAWTDPVNVRVGPGSSILRRADLKTEAIPAGDWETRLDLPMLTAHKLACNDTEIETAIRSSTDTANKVDKAALSSKMAAFGIVNGYALTDMRVWPEYLDFAWGTLWKGSKRPDPSGKWSRQSTPKEIAEAKRKMADVNQQLADSTAKTKSANEPKIKAAQVDFAFNEAAAKLRGDRKPRGWVADMLTLWQGKAEEEVAAKMGRPYITNFGDLRFLSYGQLFGNRVVVSASNGASWVEGLSTSCDVRFVTMPDANGVRRVADIRLNVDGSNIMATNSNVACSELKQAPSG